MFAALLTTLFFSLSAIFANRSLRVLGPTRANLGRLLFAAVVLGTYAHLLGGGLQGAGLGWLLFSGLVGMGLGDLALFAALPRLGSRLTVLITQCVAAPLAAAAEFLWLGTRLSWEQVLASAVILSGVALALMPSRQNPPKVAVKWTGFLWGLGSAAGQGFGAVLSRRAYEAAAEAGQGIDGITAAYQRILGGLLITGAFFALRATLRAKDAPPEIAPPPRLPQYGWIVANAGCGAIIGVSCYQWALATTPSGLVLPVVACTPLVIVPLAYVFEHERPTRRSLLGGLVAVAGVMGLRILE